MTTVDGYIRGCREKIDFLFKRKLQEETRGIDTEAQERINNALYYVYKTLENYEYEAYKQTHGFNETERTLFSAP